MTITALSPTDDDGTARRWAVSFGVVTALHALPLLVLVAWLGPVSSSPAPPPTAVMVDMAPEPVAPPASPTEIPVGPQQEVETPRPPQPVRKPKLPVVRKAEVATPIASDTPRQTDNKTPVQQTTAPAAAIAPPAAAAAPAQSASEANSNAAPTWQGLVLGRLEHFKRYPASAQSQAQQGVTYLRFIMNRDGKVLSARIEKSSGFALLDQETLALVRRAEPLPKPPPEVTGDTLELVVPIEFFLNRRR